MHHAPHRPSSRTTEAVIAEPAPTTGRGYDDAFLGIDLPLPSSMTEPELLARLEYRHFTVVLNRQRRLAELTAVNIDGASLVDVDRSDDWHLDERVPVAEQTGPDVYAGNDLDRGHLVRRRDPVWGPNAAEANDDTFTYTNAAPQVNDFNQSKSLWLGLEDYVLANAAASARRLSVFTAPVLANTDSAYRGVLIPRLFFKIAVWKADDALACTAYLLDQGELLDALTLPTAAATSELGAYRTYQVDVSEIGALTGLGLELLEAADRYRPREGTRPAGRTLLESTDDIRL